MQVPQTVAPSAAETDSQQVVQAMTGRKRYNGYLVAMLLVGGAFALHYWFYGGLGNRLPFALFLPSN